MFRKTALVAILAFHALPAIAGPASDAVRFFYVPVKWEADPDFRDRFTGPAKKLFDLNDKMPEGEIGCIDFGPGIDAQDYNDDTIKKTLKLSEDVQGDQATVTARFTLFPEGDDATREMQWLLTKEGGTWKIADIVSVSSGWKLSELECLPEG
ncbi:YbjP/YqhG family protein [Mesorhizobium sp. J428]|uniref:YbjP/YqhG family protein n=1 Tax=Mesorhizobium sp. J428 TaxID=2898440 RepID=UPI0021515121|nr:YbjP/YqhG family protein [Mesorhizobium sp. J428]MCR5855434.1 YbjP/YqhG family protein [Mesorhizobium sp. J428]